MLDAQRGGGIALTQQQETVWKAQLMAPDSDSYHIPLAFHLAGLIDPPSIDLALRRVVERHPVLRVTISDDTGDEPRQYPGPPPQSVLAVHDTEREQAEQLLAEAARRPFDQAKPLRMAAELFRWAADEALLLLVFDHVAVDAPSVAQLLHELSEDCAQLAEGRPLGEVFPEEGYFAYAREQRNRFSTPDAETTAGAAFWAERTERLDSGPDTGLRQSGEGGIPAAELAVALPDGLTEAAVATGGSLFTMLMAAYCLTLRHLSPERDVLVAYPAIDLRRAEYEGVVGLFTDGVFLRAPDPVGLSLSGYIAKVREDLLAGFDHQGAPLAAMYRGLRATGSSARAMLSLHDQGAEELTLPRATVRRVPVYPRAGKTDLMLAVEGDGETATARLQYNTDRYDETTASGFAAAYQSVLGAFIGLAAGADLSAVEVPLVPDEHRARTLDLAQGLAQPAFAPVTRLFLKQVRRTPARVAVVAAGKELSYRELEWASAVLAARLDDLGVARGATVALLLPRSAQYVVAALGVLRGGHAFLPVDPDLPPARRAFVLSDARVAAVIVATQADATELPAGVPVVALDDPAPAAQADVVQRTDRRPCAGDEPLAADPAYVITTSGSTGLPKCVQVPHGALANNLRWKAERFGFTAQDRFYFKTPPVFDASIWEFLTPLTVGASVVVAPAWAHRDPSSLAAEIEAQGVSVVQFVPTLLKALLAEGHRSSGSVRWVFCGGEALDTAVAARAVRHFEAPVVNLYGPAEAAIDVTSFTYEEDATDVGGTCAGRVPIGDPAAGAQVHILGRGRQLVPSGFPGELYIGGAPLALGYVNRRELTDERFVPHPFDAAPGARLYRTGDLAVRTSDGSLVFLGRQDGQVKVRGIRVELDDVRSVALGHPEVRDAVAVLVPGREEELLALYFLGREPDTPARLRAHLAQHLPAALLPSHLVPMDAFPLTGSGKVDVRALPAPPPLAAAPAELPRTELERRIADLWARLLDCPPDRVPRGVSFFESGGTSLTLIRLHRMLRAEFGTPVPVTALFAFPTVAAMARALRTPDEYGESS
ncbi:amino acid adenylation domain-containing protein [Streptomyces sp. N2A]|uniref:non-ribosomal peptide synthetase n=1 Tax=Streptomyces sp. N2A TaxID=3073936 RepID=UPI00286FE12B|nr:amino acid adenylation domain-containing protein [Streptomyces sp. N2A]